MPGLGAFLHVTFRAWLKDQGVDYSKVNFVEAAFPQHGDLLRGGSLDAVVTADPFMSRITDSGAGYVASYYSTFLPDGNHDDRARGQARVGGEEPGGRARLSRGGRRKPAPSCSSRRTTPRCASSIGKYIKLPPEVLAKVQISPPGPVVTDKQLAYWVGLMKEQEMLKTPLDVAKLIVK